MNRFRIFLILGLVLAFLGGVSCTAGELPTETRIGDVPSDGGAVPSDSTGAEPTDTAVTVPTDSTPVDSGPATPVDTLPITPEDTVPVSPEDSTDTPSWSDPPQNTLLVCEPLPYASATAEIGRAGGQIVVGNHSLKIPERALSERVTITMEQVEGTVNSVRFSPDGLVFEKPAVLTLSYKNCENSKHWKRIVYTDEELNILEPTWGWDFSSSSQVKSLIFHFSRYAIAF